MTEQSSRKGVVLAVLCLSVFLVVVDNTIVNVALPILSLRLHASNSALQWIVDGYSLPFAGLLLAGGGLSDRLGRKRVMQIGLAFFAVFSGFAAWSGTTSWLLTYRALMGAAAAFIFPATLSILTTTFPDPRERAKAFGVWGATSGIAVAVGPVTGGLLIEHFWWGSIFLVNLPLVAIAMLAGHFFIPESRSPFTRRVDIVGLVLGCGGITELVLAIIQGPSWGWTHGSTLGLFGLALGTLAIFTWYESRREGPLLDVRVFRIPVFTAGATSIATSFFCLFGFIFLVTQYFQLVRGYSALSAGVHTLPFAFTSAIVTPIGAVAALRLGTRWVVGSGLVIMAAALYWMSIQTASSAYFGPVVGSMIVMSFGFSLISAPSTAGIMGSLQPEQIGAGSAINNVTRELGGSLGVAVVGSVFSSLFTPAVTKVFTGGGLTSVQIAHLGSAKSMQAALSTAQILPHGGQLIPGLVDAFMVSFHRGCAVAAGVGLALSIVAFALLPGRGAGDQTGIALH